MDDYTELLAHYNPENPWEKQGLIEHLINVAAISKNLGKLVGLENSSQLIALLHDFGKCSMKFQAYIRNEYKGRVNHSSAGAIIIEEIHELVFSQYKVEELLKHNDLKKSVWTLYKEILQYPILAHHGLYDIIDKNYEYRTGKRLDNMNLSEEKIQEDGDEFLNLVNERYKLINSTTIYELYYEGFKEFIPIYRKFLSMAPKVVNRRNSHERNVRARALHFYYGSLVRLLLAILKEADIYDSSNYYRDERDKIYCQKELNNIWTSLEGIIEGQYDSFRSVHNKSELDIIRTELADDIYKFSKKYGKGTYTMDMPVGSGKTYAGLRYAIGNASRFNKKRIFYTTAFLSVLEQNASEIKKLLGKEYILEHHSNIIQDYDGLEEEKDKNEYKVGEYLKESWESPIVLTTLVQLSNTLFKDKASNIRRFAKLINSVIIIDEIQSLPTKAIYNFNLMMNFLTNIMNATIIHCTATPPGYDNEKTLIYPCKYGLNDGESSVTKSIENINVFDRVDYYSLLGENLDIEFNSDEIANHIKDGLKEENSVLVVLNTKNAVKNLYDVLSSDEEVISKNIEVIYLTTNQCPKHRLDIIEKMKERLKDIRSSKCERKIICISTKLVEAGVDIDFDIVYRSNAGIDNIIQVGGRCNREGKKSSKGRVFIFNYSEENIKYLPDIVKQRDASLTAFKVLQKKGMVDNMINIEEASKFYFHKLYQNEENMGNHMEYITKDKNDTILNLLSSNKSGRKNFENIHGKGSIYFKLRQSFKRAAKEFDLISDNTIEVIVQYNNEEKINKLYEAIEEGDFFTLKRVLEELQPYTIGIRNMQGYEKYITRELEGEILILSKEAYDKNVGLNKGELESLVW